MKKIPRHVAIILDGNRRWAKRHHLPVVAGHKKVVDERIEELIERAAEMGVGNITFWAFSTENWEREKGEVEGIMRLFMWALRHKAKRLIERGARVRMIGDLSKFRPEIRRGFEQLMKDSEGNKRITVTFALNYGGRDEIIRAIARLSRQIRNAKFEMRNLCQENFADFLDTRGMPDPDLIIRPGGEQRLSGFMLWQSEYSELYFTKTLMPDFGRVELEKAIEEYGKRQRRRGK